MCILSIENIEKIKQEVRRSEISYSHLSDDLIDHLCCDVEYEISQGETFERAWQRVKERIGIDGLKRIEEQTILFINQNYIIMKNSMRILSIVSLGLVITSAVFKIFHLPGANILLLLSFLALIFGYIPLLFLTRNKEDKERKSVTVNITGFLATILFCISILFMLMHWPGSSLLLFITWGVILLIFIPSYLYTVMKHQAKEQRATHIGIIMLISFLIIIDIVLVLNNRNADRLKYDVVENSLEEMAGYLEVKNNALYVKAQVDTLPDFQKQKINQLQERSNILKQQLWDMAQEIQNTNNFDRLRLKDEVPDSFEDQVNELRNKVNDYKKFLVTYEVKDEHLKLIVDKTLETHKVGENYVYNIYFDRPMAVVRNNLMRLYRDVLFIENELIKDLINEIQPNALI